MKQTFQEYKVVLGTRQPRSLRNLLISSRFSQRALTRESRNVGLTHCVRVCKYHSLGYVRECMSFRFGVHNQFKWIYRRSFNCDSLNVIYILICYCCWKFYIGETQHIKQRTRLHISNTRTPENSNCKKLSYHLNKCSKLKEPFFKIFPIYYVEEQQHRRFIEKRFIQRYKPPLNSDA